MANKGTPKKALFTDVVVAALVAAASTTPVAAYVAYSDHVENMERLHNERNVKIAELQLSRDKAILEARVSICDQSLGYLSRHDNSSSNSNSDIQRVSQVMQQNATQCVLPSASPPNVNDPLALPYPNKAISR